MKRFIKQIVIFATIVVAIDICYGFVLGYMYDHVDEGDIQKHNYIAKQSEDDIMMFGCSRMKYHYNPMVIEDSLGVSCFNAGEDQSGIILSYGFLMMILERYSPKMVIYDVSCYDYMVEDYESNLKYLRPYYDMKCVRDYVRDVSPMNRYKLMSSLYRFNSILYGILGSLIKEQTAYQKGYLPLTRTMDYEIDTQVVEVKPVDELKIKYLHLFIQKCKENHVSLVFCVSPEYMAVSSNLFEPVKDVCRQEGVPFIDHYCDERIVYNKEYFHDRAHMNGKGADAFTQLLVSELKHYLDN